MRRASHEINQGFLSRYWYLLAISLHLCWLEPAWILTYHKLRHLQMVPHRIQCGSVVHLAKRPGWLIPLSAMDFDWALGEMRSERWVARESQPNLNRRLTFCETLDQVERAIGATEPFYLSDPLPVFVERIGKSEVSVLASLTVGDVLADDWKLWEP